MTRPDSPKASVCRESVMSPFRHVVNSNWYDSDMPLFQLEMSCFRQVMTLEYRIFKITYFDLLGFVINLTRRRQNEKKIIITAQSVQLPKPTPGIVRVTSQIGVTLNSELTIRSASELSTGRIDPRVGSALWIFQFFTDYFLVPESIWIFEYYIRIDWFSAIFNI